MTRLSLLECKCHSSKKRVNECNLEELSRSLGRSTYCGDTPTIPHCSCWASVSAAGFMLGLHMSLRLEASVPETPPLCVSYATAVCWVVTLQKRDSMWLYLLSWLMKSYKLQVRFMWVFLAITQQQDREMSKKSGSGFLDACAWRVQVHSC